MTKVLRVTSLAASVAALALTGTPALAAPVAPTAPAQARARIIKPLTLSVTGELNFGTIVMNGLTANRTISLSSANVLDCAGGSTEVVCDPTATTVPTYTVQGTQGQLVQINKTPSSLSGSNGGALTLTPTGAASLTLSNSGAPGDPFNIGGNITIAPATLDGVYTGTLDITVQYP